MHYSSFVQAQVLLKTIEFLYTGFDLLLEEQADVLRRVVRPFFHKLFCHWSPNVRRFFHHLLIFRLVRPIGWTRVAERLPTSRVLSAESVLAAAPASSAAQGSPMGTRWSSSSRASPTGMRAGGAGVASTGRCERVGGSGVSGELSAVLASGSMQQLSASASSSFDGESVDVVSWYEAAVDDLRTGRLARVHPSLRAYVDASVRALDSLCEQHSAVLRMAASSGEPLVIPDLHWDLVLLDNEQY